VYCSVVNLNLYYSLTVLWPLSSIRCISVCKPCFQHFHSDPCPALSAALD